MPVWTRRNTNATADSSQDSSSSQTHPTGPVSTISSSDYARKCKELMELDKDLRDLGAGVLFDMPRITVIGGQSAGKSSLVEAVSGINVPRDSGTCTRCPMECTMSSAAQSWSCTIALRRHASPQGDSPGAPITVQFGPEITDRKVVELWLRRAQSAILSPHITNHEEFYKKSEADLRNLTKTDKDMLLFSKDVVVVNVKDPKLTDLSFVDLPGLIQNADQNVISLVQELVISEIRRENTLILITIPMSDDMENQQAVRLAKEADPRGERTIGVLTKPDTIPPGAMGKRQLWKDILQGQTKPTDTLKHGYYCVRLPDDDERARKISRAESQRLAAEFFDTTLPWSSIPERNRFGIPNFVSDISQLLVGLIGSNLPKLRLNVNNLLAECQVDLGALPNPITGEASTEVLLRVTKFCDDFRAAAFGESHKAMARANRSRYTRFKADIYHTRPNFQPWQGSYSRSRHPDHGEFSGLPITSMDVQEVIANSIGWELPEHVPFEATKTLILNITSSWKQPSMECFDDIVDISSHFIEKLTLEHFGQFKSLEKHIKSLSRMELEKCKTETLHTLEKTLELEKIPLFTQNTELLKAETTKWLYIYTHHCEEMEYHNPSVKVAHIIPSDPVLAMAKVRAYFQVAFNRIIDYVPLIIEHELNQAVSLNLQKTLFDSLLGGSGVARRMKELLSEDPDVASRRTFLEEKKARLVQIKARLDNFHDVSG